MRRTQSSIKIALFILLALATVASMAAASYLADEPPTYTIYDGETPMPVTGEYETVGQLLDAVGIEIRPEDQVTPEVSEIADPGVAIQIQRSQPVTVRTDSGKRTYWTLRSKLSSFLSEAQLFVAPSDQIYADGVLIPYETLADTPLPDSVDIGRFLTITVIDGTHKQLLQTSSESVAEALQEAQLQLDPADGVTPELGASLEPGMIITVQRAIPITVKVDGEIKQIKSSQPSVSEALAEAQVLLGEYDYTIPGNEATLQANSIIEVVRVTEDFLLEDESIPFQTLWQATDELLIDTTAVLQEGVTGISRRRIRVRYENGVEISRVPDGEWIAREPANRIIGYGTRIELGIIDTPEGPREYWRAVEMRVTSYTAATSGKEPGDPGYGRTASGVQAGYGVVAVDRNVVPFRSHVYVPGYGVGFVGDTGGGIRGRWIDLGYDEDAFEWWAGYTTVYYLTPVPPPGDINYILPATLP